MNSFQILRPADNLGMVEKELLTKFIMEYCVVPAKPKKKQVSWSVDHATSIFPHQGGHIIKMFTEDQLTGIAIINKTGMENQISAYVLSHVALVEDDNVHLESIINKARRLTKGNLQGILDNDRLTNRFRKISKDQPRAVQLIKI